MHAQGQRLALAQAKARERERLRVIALAAGRSLVKLTEQVIAWQRSQRPAVGRIAVEWGHLSDDEVRSRLVTMVSLIALGPHALWR